MSAERTWSEWFTSHLRSLPWQIRHMRELAENTIAANDTSAVRVSGSSEKARLPFRVEPADDADLLYVHLIEFGQWVAEQIGGSSPRALREGMWRGAATPQGLPLCTPDEAFTMSIEITEWLITNAEHIAINEELADAPDALIDSIREMRRRYPRSEPKFKAYRPRPCPTCGERTILPVWGKNGLDAMKCDTCETVWPSNRASKTKPTTVTPKLPPE